MLWLIGLFYHLDFINEEVPFQLPKNNMFACFRWIWHGTCWPHHACRLFLICFSLDKATVMYPREFNSSLCWCPKSQRSLVLIHQTSPMPMVCEELNTSMTQMDGSVWKLNKTQTLLAFTYQKLSIIYYNWETWSFNWHHLFKISLKESIEIVQQKL